MFTGIIETTGIIKEITSKGTNLTFWIESSISNELKIDQSVSHNGVCLTVEEIKNNSHRVTAIEETLKKTNLHAWKKDDLINIERCLLINSRFDGHIVQGHADTTAICKSRKEVKGSWEFSFEFSKTFSHLIVEKGSISLNGISLTIFNVKKKSFSVAIIPYTFEHTNIQNIFPGSKVNIEFDIVGKYISRQYKK
jgi:riboflavin synthase